jgi:hypothetical protein
MDLEGEGYALFNYFQEKNPEEEFWSLCTVIETLIFGIFIQTNCDMHLLRK